MTVKVKTKRDNVDITLSKKEVYIILQCLSETHDKMSENDIQTILDSTSSEVEKLTDKIRAFLEVEKA